jgi:uncharacterized radical SAM protein YgiQ
MSARGWDQLDVLLVSGDAYIDHPTFGAALLGRWLEAHGFRVGIVAQPRWDSPADIARMGRPRLFCGVTAGAMDSMLAHYTAFRKKRHDDAYTPGGRAGARPNRACIVYAGLVKQAFAGLPVVLGGIEASLRRATHYDFWTDKLRRSILLDAKATCVLYGMAEAGILSLAQALAQAPDAPAAEMPRLLAGVRGAVLTGPRELAGSDAMELPSHEDIAAHAPKLMTLSLAMERQVHERLWALQQCEGRTVIFTPPAPPLTQRQMDELYALPFTRRPHPSYSREIPAATMIAGSITSHRGCAGGCSFCSLALHQGRRIQSRSPQSIRSEAAALAAPRPAAITDVGGPTANMWGARCASPGPCSRQSCLFPQVCPHFEANQFAMIDLLRSIARLPGVSHVRVASGVRHDLAMRDPRYVEALCGEFVGGQLKLAPEHIVPRVLELMRKPAAAAFESFLESFDRASRARGKRQFIVPYLMSAFPGCTESDMRRLADWLHQRGWQPQQVQCFIPTPGTVATAMYYAGIDPAGNAIPVARTDAQRLRLHGILVRTGSAPKDMLKRYSM